MRTRPATRSIFGTVLFLLMLVGASCGGDDGAEDQTAAADQVTETTPAVADTIPVIETSSPPSDVAEEIQADPVEQIEEIESKPKPFPSHIRAPELTAPAARRAAPSVPLTDLNGRQLTMESLRGEVVLLTFWATWCPPCKKEIPHLVHLQDVYGDLGLTILAPSLDDKGLVAIKPFLRSRPEINYTIIPSGQRLSMAYGGVNRIPTSFLIDKQGRVIERIQGLRSGQELEGLVMAALREDS